MIKSIFYRRITNRMLKAEIVGNILESTILIYCIVQLMDIFTYYSDTQTLEILGSIAHTLIFFVILVLVQIVQLWNVIEFRKTHDFSSPFATEVRLIKRSFKSGIRYKKPETSVISKKTVNINIIFSSISIIIALFFLCLSTYMLYFA